MGDRICVMKDGEIQQVAAPLELYNHPANLFVAGFIGSPPMNFFRGELLPNDGRLRFRETSSASSPLSFNLPESIAARANGSSNRMVVLGIRPENVQDTGAIGSRDPESSAVVTVEVAEPMGAETLLYLSTGASSFIARVGPTDRFEPNQTIRVSFDLNRAHLFDAETGQVLK